MPYRQKAKTMIAIRPSNLACSVKAMVYEVFFKEREADIEDTIKLENKN